MLDYMKQLMLILFLLLSSPLLAQDKIPVTEDDYQNTRVEMADGMRASGKIYVLVAIISVVLGGLLAYVIVVDRKVSKLEDDLKDLKDAPVDLSKELIED